MVTDENPDGRGETEPEAQSARGLQLRAEMGLLVPEDLADMIGVGTRQLQVWRSESVGPDYVKLGKRVFYRRDDVLSWIEANIKTTRTRVV